MRARAGAVAQEVQGLAHTVISVKLVRNGQSVTLIGFPSIQGVVDEHPSDAAVGPGHWLDGGPADAVVGLVVVSDVCQG